MTATPNNFLFSKTHEWLNPHATPMTVGISDHAQNLLGDIVFIELPEIGSEVKAGQEIGVLESVKAASDYYAPISGVVTAINHQVQKNPELINQDPYGQGWICQITPINPSETAHLINSAVYEQQITEA